MNIIGGPRYFNCVKGPLVEHAQHTPNSCSQFFFCPAFKCPTPEQHKHLMYIYTWIKKLTFIFAAFNWV